ncbi:MAG: dimethylsulfoxide reductase subunit B [Anaerolineales bacterium]|nr:dimethylsulfoxide reductase subunit B [Anaerolineales bacterium]
MTQLAFYFDARACSGCKACQAACKDKHDLPVGVLWRRVYEVSGGEWQQQEEAWITSAFAYNLSIACNHCARPICVEVCPAAAISKRPDGIVLIDERRCIGCKYCSWACPYGAPQYDPGLGILTKCDFCVDNIDAGLPPACVAACPMRVLDFGDLEELEERYGPGGNIFPLPAAELTEPALIVRPHQAALKAASQAEIANREEV